MKRLAQRFFNRSGEPEYFSAEGTEVKILFSSENPSLLGKTIKTQAVEISKDSIRLAINHAIEIDSVLDISIKLGHSERSYNLTGNIRWRLPSFQDEYQVVLVLRERNDIRSDLRAWRANFKQNYSLAQAI